MKPSLRTLKIGAAIVALLVATMVAMAAEKNKANSEAKPAATTAKTQNCQQGPYLGVAIERLSPAFASQFPKMFRNGQGVLVAAVADGSPAQKAGVQPHDVLMAYGNQKLFSPEQLVKLVRADKVGTQVTLNLVREGKPKKIAVTLGQCNLGKPFSMGWNLPELLPWAMPTRSMIPTASNNNEKVWESFESMSIKNLGDHRFKAEIGYLDKDGKVVHHEFEGTRPEIHKAILGEKDLPATEREQLFRSLDMTSGESQASPVRVSPSSNYWWNFYGPNWVF